MLDSIVGTQRTQRTQRTQDGHGDGHGDGDGDGAVSPMTRDELVAPYVRSFRSTDPGKGGCPEVPV